MWHFDDDYSGMNLTWRIDKTENAGLVRLAIGDVCREYGIPDVFVIDNTLAASAKWITGRSPSRHRFKIRFDEPLGLIGQLGSRHIATLPRVGGSSKRDERAGGDWDRDIARSPGFDGAWLGTNPMTRPDSARKPVPLATFLEVVGQGMIAHNTRPGRRGANCNGRSLLETFRESYERSVIRKATPEQLRLCLLAAEKVQCQKANGTISLFGNLFGDNDEDRRVAAFAGQRIIVRYDPQALHKGIFVYSPDDKFVGEAKCLAPTGFLDAGAAREHNRRRRQNLKHYKKIADNERTMSALELAALQPKLPDPNPPMSKVVRLFQNRIEAPQPSDFVEDEPDEIDPRTRRYRELKERAERAPDTLDADDWATIKIFESGVRPIRGRA
jgi:putative transposase